MTARAAKRNAPTRILVVEDDFDLLEIMKLKLEFAGFAVIEAADGEQALKLAKRNTPDLVLLDIMLPGKDGYEVCKAMRSDKKLKHTPIIMVTAKALSDDEKMGILSGANDYITKPFGFNDLFERITKLTSSK